MAAAVLVGLFIASRHTSTPNHVATTSYQSTPTRQNISPPNYMQPSPQNDYVPVNSNQGNDTQPVVQSSVPPTETQQSDSAPTPPDTTMPLVSAPEAPPSSSDSSQQTAKLQEQMQQTAQRQEQMQQQQSDANQKLADAQKQNCETQKTALESQIRSLEDQKNSLHNPIGDDYPDSLALSHAMDTYNRQESALGDQISALQTEIDDLNCSQ
jgi:hypothetical protein